MGDKSAKEDHILDPVMGPWDTIKVRKFEVEF
jgi:hypothetical protein